MRKVWKRIAGEEMTICFMENEILEPINSENEVKKKILIALRENGFQKTNLEWENTKKWEMCHDEGRWPCRSGTCRYDRGCITCVWVLSLDLHLQSIEFRAISRSFIFL